MLAQLRSGLRAVFLRSRLESEMDIELRWHLDNYVEGLTRTGISHEEAQRRARLELGDLDMQKEKCRDSLGLRFLDEMGADFRFALRSLRKQRLLAANVVITLTLGIGISSGVFNFLDAIALRPEIEKDRASYVEIFSFFTMDATRPMELSAATLQDYLAFRDKTRSLREIVACGHFQLNLESDDLSSTHALLVSSNFFSLYDLKKAKLGRLLQPEDYSKSSPVVVLSEDLWRDRFAANQSIIGKTIHVNEQLVTVVGVAPHFASGMNSAAAWLPYTLTTYLGLGEQWTRPGEVRWLGLAGRLNPGFSRADVAAELAMLIHQQDGLHQGRISKLLVTDGSQIHRPPADSRVAWMVALIMGVLLMVLIISCANVTTLLLSRADARQQEMGVRLALGASRTRLIRMQVTETVLLASVAGAASLYLAYRFPFLLWLWVARTTVDYPLDPDWRLFSFLAVSTLLAGTLAGLAPALESLKVDLVGSLKGQRRFFTRRATGGGLRNFLVATQVAISLVLLVGSGLFVRAHHQILNADPGYETRQVILTNLFTPSAKTPQSRANFRDNLTRQIEALPGVRSTALASNVQPSLEGEQLLIQLPGKSPFPVASIQVSANYFATMSIPIPRGRALERNDAPCGTQAGVCPVVVSQQFAREILDGSDVIGKTLRTPDGGTLEIVGIAGDVSDLFTRVSRPAIYRAWSPVNLPPQFTLLVRVAGNAETMAADITDILRKTFVGSKVEARTVHAMIYLVAGLFWRLEMLILLLGVLAVLLAVIGIYGVVSFAVSKRTKEIGIRIALGAMKKDIYAAVIGSSMRPIWIGLCVGILLAIGGARVLQQALKPIARVFAYNDALSYAAPACLLLAVSVIAMLGPARRAAACDPSKTLREE
jgi:predicted permease